MWWHHDVWIWAEKHQVECWQSHCKICCWSMEEMHHMLQGHAQAHQGLRLVCSLKQVVLVILAIGWEMASCCKCFLDEAQNNKLFWLFWISLCKQRDACESRNWHATVSSFKSAFLRIVNAHGNPGFSYHFGNAIEKIDIGEPWLPCWWEGLQLEPVWQFHLYALLELRAKMEKTVSNVTILLGKADKKVLKSGSVHCENECEHCGNNTNEQLVVAFIQTKQAHLTNKSSCIEAMKWKDLKKLEKPQNCGLATACSPMLSGCDNGKIGCFKLTNTDDWKIHQMKTSNKKFEHWSVMMHDACCLCGVTCNDQRKTTCENCVLSIIFDLAAILIIQKQTLKCANEKRHGQGQKCPKLPLGNQQARQFWDMEKSPHLAQNHLAVWVRWFFLLWSSGWLLLAAHCLRTFCTHSCTLQKTVRFSDSDGLVLPPEITQQLPSYLNLYPIYPKITLPYPNMFGDG